jgi:hypothetical protein
MYGDTQDTRDSYNDASQLLVRPIYLWMGVPRLFIHKGYGLIEALYRPPYVCMYVRMYAG